MRFAELVPRLLQELPEEATAIGFALRNDAGQLLLVESEGDGPDGSAALPAVRVRRDEPAANAFARCLRERVGAEPESLFPVAGLWQMGHGRTKFFSGLLERAAEPEPVGRRAQVLAWRYPQAAAQLLESPSAASRQRYRGVLEAASSLCISPYRRQLLALRELHRMGFERLRALAYMAPSGCYWRCEYRPVNRFVARTGAGADPEMTGTPERPQPARQRADYSSSTGQVPFGWDDAVFDTPRLLAEKLLERRRELVHSGRGSDPAYVAWFDRVLEATRPLGIFSAFDDSSPPGDHVELLRTPAAGRFAAPPPPAGLERGQ